MQAAGQNLRKVVRDIDTCESAGRCHLRGGIEQAESGEFVSAFFM
jgi:hypothetical protein